MGEKEKASTFISSKHKRRGGERRRRKEEGEGAEVEAIFELFVGEKSNKHSSLPISKCRKKTEVIL